MRDILLSKMALFVKYSQLEELIRILEANVPNSLHVLGHAISKRMRLIECKIVVNSWPDPKVFIVAPRKREAEKYQRISIFTTSILECALFLSRNEIINWNKPLLFTAIDADLRPFITTEASRRHAHCRSIDYLLHYTLQDQPQEGNLPEELEYTTLTTADLPTLRENWEFSTKATDEENKHIIEHLPTAAVRCTQTKDLVGWVVIRFDWSMAKVRIVPQYRGKGVLQALGNKLLENKRKIGGPEFGFRHISVNNKPSRAASLRNGYHEAETQFCSVYYDPAIHGGHRPKYSDYEMNSNCSFL